MLHSNASMPYGLFLMFAITCAGKYTVPILWDKTTRTIVNNESSDIIEMLDRDFSAIAKSDAPDLNPKDTYAAQEAANEWIYPGINNGVYRSGFAQSQAAYDTAVTEVFDALDKAEGILSKQRYIAGEVALAYNYLCT
jgi:glutathionyl-hydroquinone reductase